MHHSIEVFIVLLFATVLLIGAATRRLSRFSGIPFTIMMLVFGLLGGLYIKHFTSEMSLFHVFHGVEGDNIISPELILFIFLPMLIFESAFSLDAHIFRKSLGNIVLLAGPALIITTSLTAFLMLAITPESWGWTLSYALLFGALINATDPVAVVALLRELGISKKLVTLIEGESLLNDGTAIVLFTVFLAMSLSGNETFALSEMSFHFLKVVLGGVLIGWLLAQIISRWIGTVFNDPLVEITLMMALAYLAMVIAEHFFHVSGIMALVVAGLYMSSIGRTRISPEVMHFLHDFWEMMAYIANSLIFFLVGLVIALQIDTFTLTELWVAVVAYIGIMLIRFGAVFAFRPLFSSIGTPVNSSSAVIASWGGLRGAVSLALVLILSQTPGLDESFRHQALLITVLIVLTTVVFNGATMKPLLRRLGLDKPSLSTQVSSNLAKISVLNDVKKMINKLSKSDDFKNVYWSEVRDEIEDNYRKTRDFCSVSEKQLEQFSKIEHEAEFWQRILNVERNAYWELFAQGILTDKALSILNHELDIQNDDLKEGIINPPKQRTPKPGNLYVTINMMLQRNNFLKKYLGFLVFDIITMNFHFLHAEEYASRRVLEKISALEGMNKDYECKIRQTYTTYLHSAKSQLEQMRSDLPELTQAIETNFARRLTLNRERRGILSLIHHGIIDEGMAKEDLESVESRMHTLKKFPKNIKLPTTRELIAEIPLFELCSDDELDEIANIFVEHIVLKGEYLFMEGEFSDSMFIVVRGALEVYKRIDNKQKLLGVLGGGDIVGEIALLTGQPRMASTYAATTVTLLRIDRKHFESLTQKYPHLRDHTWAAYGRHQILNQWKSLPNLKTYHEDKVHELLANAKVQFLKQASEVNASERYQYLYVINGMVEINSNTYSSGKLNHVDKDDKILVSAATWVLWL